jgi:cob(I)alamin adenosyltransferase
MSIYTRRGDHGETSLASGTRVRKDSPRVEAFGTVDEANSLIGFARAAAADAFLVEVLRFAQHRLFNCSSQLASATPPALGSPLRISPADVTALERAIDRFEQRTGPAETFVLEGGCDLAARLHMARATVRRAERRVTALAREGEVAPDVLAFLNRLSDVLFAAARFANAGHGAPEEPWEARALASWTLP